MIDRRSFVRGAAGLGLAGSSALWPARAQALKPMRMGNAAGINDAQQCYATCGRHPRLGYYKAEGVDLEFVNMSNVSQTMQAIATNEVAFGTLVPGLYLPALAKNPTLGVVSVYNWMPRQGSTLAVKPSSPIKTIADLKGMRIGIRNQGDSGIFVMRAMMREIGVDDSTLQFIAVGDGGVAGTALHQDRVDAIASYDTAAARIELAGFALRYLPLTPAFARVTSATFGVSKKLLAEDRKSLVGLFRAMAKSTLFARANLAQAINIHWALYPESKSKTKSEDESRKEFEFLLKDRKNNWVRGEDDPEKRMGSVNASEAKALVALAAETSGDPQLGAKLGDTSAIFVNDLVDEINAFDKAAVVQQALSFKL